MSYFSDNSDTPKLIFLWLFQLWAKGTNVEPAVSAEMKIYIHEGKEANWLIKGNELLLLTSS